jgi:hypothetical protein
MNKSFIRVAALCSVVSSSVVHATAQFRSPLSYENRGVMHYELKPVRDTWWFDSVASEDCKEHCWTFDLWSVIYGRSANKAFFSDSVDCDGKFKNKTTRDTTTLSQLWFGIDTPAASFTGLQTLAGGQVSNLGVLSDNSALGWSQITPNFKYTESGLAWGFDARKNFGKDNRWYVGKRANLPFKVIEVKQCPTANGQVSEGLEDVALTRLLGNDIGASPTQFEYAYRLDFLSTLASAYAAGPVLVATPLVQYTDGSPTAGNMTIGGQDVTGPNAGTFDGSIPPVYAVRRTDLTAPAVPYRKQYTQVTGQVAPDGSGGGNNAVLFFAQSTDYIDGLGQSPAAQSELWIVPRRLDSTDTLTTGAQAIGNIVQSLININSGTINQTAADIFLTQGGIDLAACERRVGLGDLNAEMYVGFQQDTWFMDGIIGVLFPTGKTDSDVSRIYLQTTGNNGHFEIKLGLEGGWNPKEWFAFRWDAAYHHAFQRTEQRAASFAGTTVRNIAPAIDVKVQWNYLVLHTDFNFFHPCNPDLGAVISYELFAKQNDRVRLSCPDTACGVAGNALDLLGQSGPLDLSLMEERTDSMTHKIRGEVFHRVAFAELFAGASQIIAGRNAMKETEVHLGVAVYF